MSNATFDPTSIGSALADAITRVSPAVVHVTSQDRHASGVVWSATEGLVVTSSRLFHERGADAAVSIDAGQGARAGTLVGLDEATELALVRLAAPADAGLVDPVWLDDGARVGLFVAPVARTSSGVRTTFGVVTRVGPAWVTARGGTVDAHVDVDGTLPPGFSGGPLVDFGGRVLGVNTRGLVPGGATLPTTTVRRVVGLLAAGTSTAPGHLGVGIQAIDLPAHLRVDPSIGQGLLVHGVVPGSAAERAGIVAGDVIVAIDGRPIPDHAHLLAALAGKVGRPVKVRVARHGQPLELDATPAAREERRRKGPPMAQALRGLWGKGCR